MKNKELARIFERIADALEFKGEMVFKVLAYRKAARVLDELAEDVEVLRREDRLSDVPGIGAGIARKIIEYLDTGRMKKYEEVTKRIPEALLSMLDIQNLGPKTLSLANKELKVKSIDDLKRVIASGKLAALPRMGEKKVENIRKGIELYERGHARLSIALAERVASEVIAYLKEHARVKDIAAAGSLRRWKETIGDVDILVTGKDGAGIVKAFTQYPRTERVLAAGDTKGSIVVEGGVQVDIRIVAPGAYGAALQYFTGSKAHNVRCRNIAREKKMKLSEYGLFRGAKLVAGRSEKDIYARLGLDYIPPELREDRGEIEAAQARRLPRLVELKRIRGDLHMHSVHSDSEATIADLVRAAEELGYEYILVTDHSQSVTYARGLEPARLRKQWKEIEAINERSEKVRVLKGAEVDIRADGTLDYPDEILKRLDLVVASIHQGFKKNVTERMCAAMENPYVDIIGHPTGRLISSREGYAVDLHAVMEKAAATGTWLECNAYWDRLDLNDTNLRAARDMGVKISFGTDAHDVAGLGSMKFGVATARRAWLEARDIVNTYPLKKLLASRKMHRNRNQDK